MVVSRRGFGSHYRDSKLGESTQRGPVVKKRPNHSRGVKERSVMMAANKEGEAQSGCYAYRKGGGDRRVIRLFLPQERRAD